ncbi:hypothetical protein Aduo_013743 [Ancylostoma duodenale]
MSALLYYACPVVPFVIDLIVLVPFWHLVTVVDIHDYLAIYMIAVNIPYTIRLVPQYINLLAPVVAPATKVNTTIASALPSTPFGTMPNQAFFSMMSAFIVLSISYGSFNVLLGMLQEIRRGKPSKWHLWLPFIIMMALIQGILIAVYKYQFLSESIILFLVLYYIAICFIMAIIVRILLRRNRPNDSTWEKRRQGIECKFNRFILFALITCVPSFLYMRRLSMMVLNGYFFATEPEPVLYNFTEYMFHPWMFNLIGVTLLDPFRKITVGHLRPLESYYRKYRWNFRGGPTTIPSVYKVPPPSYTEATQKKTSRPTQMY